MKINFHLILDEVFEFIGDETSGFQCTTCNISFSNVDEHLKDYHNNKEDVEYTEKVEEPLEYVEVEGMAFVIKNNEGKFECQEKDCSRTYKSLNRFLEHVKTHGSVAPESIQKLEEYIKQLEDSEDIFEITQLEDGKKNYQCKVCCTNFDCRRKVVLHYPIHRNVAKALKKHKVNSGESFHCKLCNRSLNNDYELKLHLKAHEENQTGQATTTEKIVHKKIVSEDGKSTYPCQYCSKIFKRPHEKVKHERIHTGEKPYSWYVKHFKIKVYIFLIYFCSSDICGKSFRVTYCLSLHKKNVHSEERPYVCSFDGCNKR